MVMLTVVSIGSCNPMLANVTRRTPCITISEMSEKGMKDFSIWGPFDR